MIPGLNHLRTHGVRWNVLTAVHHVNEDHGMAVYRLLRDDLAAQSVQLNPACSTSAPAARTSSGPSTGHHLEPRLRPAGSAPRAVAHERPIIGRHPVVSTR